jgi:Invasion associated locus B (IalB) protein
MILKRPLGRAALFLTAMLVPATAFGQAKDPTPLGESGDWAAYAYKAKGGKVCYVVAQPKGSVPKGAKRDPIFFLVTHRPGQAVRNEVSTIIGYSFKKDATVEIKIDETAYTLFTNGDGAWADSKDKDKKVVAAMKKGKAMTVKGTSLRGTETADTYSLKGVSGALDKIDAACK